MDSLKFSDKFLYKTGERIIPGSVSAEALSEHYTRYHYAQNICKDKKVLNVACGAGYGSEILLRTASEVDNIDISEQLVAYGNLKYGNFRNHFLTMDAQKMSYPNKYFDVIVSFETFEHLPKYKNFINECFRVLKDGGILVLSMPNKNVTSPGLKKPANPYHFKEWTILEFRSVINGKFKVQNLLGQNKMKPVYFSETTMGKIYRNILNFVYFHTPAVLIRLLKVYVFKFKYYPFHKIKLSPAHSIVEATDKDFDAKNGMGYAIILASLRKTSSR